MGKSRITGLSGQDVTIEVDDQFESSTAVTSIAVYEVDGVAIEFVGGPQTYGRAVAQYVGITFSRDFRLQGGVLRMGSTAVEEGVTDQPNEYSFTFMSERWVAAWEGEFHSVQVDLWNTTPERIVNLFSQFTFLDTPMGVSMAPRSNRAREVEDKSCVLKEVPGLGLLNIKPQSRSRRAELPNWRGTTVLGGEAYCDASIEGQPQFVLANDTSHVLVMPTGRDPIERTMRGVETLRVHWARP